ncbi:LCP family protein [Streptomyces sp. DSM 44915]|uniref:LCP family protein n=1 Tax=Streptomyces chisholmiae TaxID=3075540 RepID=A0ABU2JNV7_9ACTN|nr:LCP family protein [Streptomyces sp. DSM 44915]MDT0266681.1 LCP family protein [Streptomyces sp. DSM 44915]
MPGTHRSARPRRAGRARTRTRRILLWTAGTLALLVLVAAGAGAWLYYRLNGNITAAEVDDKLGEDRPEDLSPGAKTILVAGSDTREDTDGSYGHTEGMRSDTLMVVHVAENREWATVLSLPRDSWVEIPACQLDDGSSTEPHFGKINESFALGGMHGDAGSAAACTIRTLEHNTGLRIDNFVSLDFLGFKDMVDALGGVEVCPEEPIDDDKAHIQLEAGCQMLDGEQALGYVRVRYSVGDGSDIGRISRQQEFMRSLAERAQDRLTSPTSMYDFLDAVTRSLTTDPELAGLQPLYDLASDLQSVPEENLTFLTVPNYPRELDVPEDTANVVWQYPHTDLLFDALAHDRFLSEDELAAAAEELLAMDPAEIRVRVLNGTDVPGRAAEVADELRAAGFQVTETDNAPAPVPTTVISHPEALAGQARALAARLPGSAVETAAAGDGEGAGGGELTLTLGPDYPGLRAPR